MPASLTADANNSSILDFLLQELQAERAARSELQRQLWDLSRADDPATTYPLRQDQGGNDVLGQPLEAQHEAPQHSSSEHQQQQLPLHRTQQQYSLLQHHQTSRADWVGPTPPGGHPPFQQPTGVTESITQPALHFNGPQCAAEMSEISQHQSQHLLSATQCSRVFQPASDSCLSTPSLHTPAARPAPFASGASCRSNTGSLCRCSWSIADSSSSRCGCMASATAATQLQWQQSGASSCRSPGAAHASAATPTALFDRLLPADSPAQDLLHAAAAVRQHNSLQLLAESVLSSSSSDAEDHPAADAAAADDDDVASVLQSGDTLAVGAGFGCSWKQLARSRATASCEEVLGGWQRSSYASSFQHTTTGASQSDLGCPVHSGSHQCNTPMTAGLAAAGRTAAAAAAAMHMTPLRPTAVATTDADQRRQSWDDDIAAFYDQLCDAHVTPRDQLSCHGGQQQQQQRGQLQELGQQHLPCLHTRSRLEPVAASRATDVSACKELQRQHCYHEQQLQQGGRDLQDVQQSAAGVAGTAAAASQQQRWSQSQAMEPSAQQQHLQHANHLWQQEKHQQPGHLATPNSSTGQLSHLTAQQQSTVTTGWHSTCWTGSDAAWQRAGSHAPLQAAANSAFGHVELQEPTLTKDIAAVENGLGPYRDTREAGCAGCDTLSELLLEAEFVNELTAAQLAVVVEDRDLLKLQHDSLLQLMAEQQLQSRKV